MFGGSEGKNKKGLHPTTVNFSTDLHAIRQFIQEGSPIIFETLLYFHDITDDCRVPNEEKNEDQLHYLSSRTFNVM
ncbi:hypothetical protein [Lysinibacillus sp. NPDC092081]|uniref:hypothetical protein n=1 Tax=Lysinibacillus sp. NPDC092081 TaxID=3364131 RepID=UPI003818FCF2